MSEFNRDRVVDVLQKESKVTIVSERTVNDAVSAILFDDTFDTLKVLSDLLDENNAHVSKTMWVDEGQKFYIEPR